MTGGPDWKHLDFSKSSANQWIRDESGLDEIVVDALLDEDSRPRAMQMGEGVLVILRGVNMNPGSSFEDMISIRLWLEKDRIISTGRRNLKSVADMRRAVESGQGPKTPGEFLLMLVERLSDLIADATEKIEESLESAEESVSSTEKIARNSPFSVIRRQTARIRRYLAPQREALDQVSRYSDSLFDEHERVLLREQVNRLNLILEDLDLARERALVAQEEYLGIVAHEQNSRMLVLSIVAAVFLPLGFLTGLMGMNVAGLPGLEFEGAFWILVGLMVFVCGAILVLFRIKKWF